MQLLYLSRGARWSLALSLDNGDGLLQSILHLMVLLLLLLLLDLLGRLLLNWLLLLDWHRIRHVKLLLLLSRW